MKYLDINAHSMRKKQEEHKALAKSQRSDISGVSESWWDESCGWSALMDDYRLSRRTGRGGDGEVAL